MKAEALRLEKKQEPKTMESRFLCEKLIPFVIIVSSIYLNVLEQAVLNENDIKKMDFTALNNAEAINEKIDKVVDRF